MKTGRLTVFLVASLWLAGCGPTTQKDLSMKSVPVPILLHAQPPAAAAPSPAVSPVPVPVIPLGNGIAIVPPTEEPVVPTPPPPAPAPSAPPCPALSPFAAPARPATPSIVTTAVNGRFAFRNIGTINGANPGPSVVTVTDASQSSSGADQTYHFTVTDVTAGVTTQRSFQATYTAAGTVETGELDLMSIADSKGYSVSFAAGLKLLQTPATPGTSWQSAATDPVHATTYTFSGQVVKRMLVNACGAAVDTWEVTGTEGATGPSESVSYSLEFNVATGYGGFIVQEARQCTGGTRYGAAFDENLTTIINQAKPS